MNTLQLLQLAMERSCADPDYWDAYWQQRELDGPAIWALIRRSAYLASSGNPAAAAAAATMLTVGFELGRLSCDPASKLSPLGYDVFKKSEKDDRPTDDPRFQRGAH